MTQPLPENFISYAEVVGPFAGTAPLPLPLPATWPRDGSNAGVDFLRAHVAKLGLDPDKYQVRVWATPEARELGRTDGGRDVGWLLERR